MLTVRDDDHEASCLRFERRDTLLEKTLGKESCGFPSTRLSCAKHRLDGGRISGSKPLDVCQQICADCDLERSLAVLIAVSPAGATALGGTRSPSQACTTLHSAQRSARKAMRRQGPFSAGLLCRGAAPLLNHTRCWVPAEERANGDPPAFARYSGAAYNRHP